MEPRIEKINLRTSVLILMVILATLSRVAPHMPNFSPLGAIGLFGAAHFNKKWQAFLLPLFAVWLSDIFINNIIYAYYYPSITLLYEGFYWQYGSYLLTTLAGIFILKNISIKKLFLASITSTTIFFLVSNFGCWPGNPAYTQNLSGLLSCYIAGIPFIKGTFLGDLVYTGVLFASFHLLEQRFTKLQTINN